MLPSFVITGFLGSGKTTLLINSVRSAFEDKKVAIVVNEFGEVGFDGQVLKNVYSDVLELSEGCICCTLTAEFEKGVREILEKYSPDVLFVETSGVSEPFPIMFSLQSMGLSVEGVICVVDSANFFKYQSSKTARHQIGSSNIIVLNKTDLVKEDELKSVEEEVRKIRKEYSLRNFFTGEEVFPKYILVKTSFGRIPPELFRGVQIPHLPMQDDHHSHGDELFHQRVVRPPEGMTYAELEEFFKKLPEDVIRAKGIVRLRDVDHPLLVNYSFGSFEVIGEKPDYQGEGFLVLIGYNQDGKNPVFLNFSTR